MIRPPAVWIVVIVQFHNMFTSQTFPVFVCREKEKTRLMFKVIELLTLASEHLLLLATYKGETDSEHLARLPAGCRRRRVTDTVISPRP